MISLNINSLFTNAPLHDTIDTFLRRIYINKEIITNLTKKELKELILLCTKDVHQGLSYKKTACVRYDKKGKKVQ